MMHHRLLIPLVALCPGLGATDCHQAPPRPSTSNSPTTSYGQLPANPGEADYQAAAIEVYKRVQEIIYTALQTWGPADVPYELSLLAQGLAHDAVLVSVDHHNLSGEYYEGAPTDDSYRFRARPDIAADRYDHVLEVCQDYRQVRIHDESGQQIGTGELMHYVVYYGKADSRIFMINETFEAVESCPIPE